MLKHLSTLCAATLIAVSTQAQTTYLATSFDEGIPETFQNWDIDENQPSTDMANLGFTIGTAWIVTTEGKDNNAVACSTSWYKNAGTSNDWMVLPPIEIKDAEAKIIWRARASDKDLRDGYKLYIGHFPDADSGRDYIMPDDFDLLSPLYSTNKETFDWNLHTISLADYVGQTVYLAFVNDSKDKTCLYIDDIFVGVPAAVGLSLDFGRCYDGYGDITISGKAYATLSQPVEQYTIGFEMNGKTIEQTFDGTLEPGVQVPFTLSETAYLEKNATADYRAWIKAGDDQSEQNGRLSAYLWKVVAEEVTGTWCQYCVRGIGAMNYMRENDPEGFIDGYPHCVLNRNAQYSIDPGIIPTTAASIKRNGQNYYGLTLSATYNPETNRIAADTEVLFAKDFDNTNFKLAYIVIENDVHRTHAETGILDNYCGYDQVNAYAGGAMGECYGFENLPGIVNADDIWYQDVARGYDGTDGYKGIEGLFPKNISEGDVFTHQMELDMPETVLVKENAELVVLLLSKSGAILNAEKCPIAQQSAEPTAVEFGAVVQRHTEPAVYDLQGRVVSKSGHSLQPGIYIIGGKKVVVK